MNKSSKRGRPRKFDIDKAVKKATNVFWQKGYEGASLNDLTEAMGINGPSLYAAFGSKFDLFIETINAYIDNKSCNPLIAFEQESDIKIAVQSFLTAVIDYSLDGPKGTSGCFLSSCVATSAGDSKDVQKLLKKAITETDRCLEARFNLEKENGVLSSDFPSAERARLMFDMRQGYVLRARAGLSKVQLLRDLDQRVKIILS